MALAQCLSLGPNRASPTFLQLQALEALAGLSGGPGRAVAPRFAEMPLSVIALIGIILLIGIVKKNGIMLVDF
jgi:AcrB/AcrD/AcrF family